MAGVALQRQHGVDAPADAFGQLGHGKRKRFAVVDDLAVTQRKGARPLRTPGLQLGSGARVGGPAQFLAQGLGHIAQLHGGVVIVPPEHAQGGQVAFGGLVGEMGQRNFTGVALAKARNKQQVVRCPGLVAATGRTAFWHQTVEHAAQRGNGQAAFVELYKENTPGLAADQGAQLFDGFDLDFVLGLEVELVGLPVKEVVFPVLHIDGPAQLVVQVVHQGWNGMNLAQFVG
ncbi:hypothetical protein [Rhodoferax antarcticus]|uniref:hypothetical protein n=1 Tax=Rhodoferax antarcticus TaxID=81479 RepID=UPI00111523D5|nr:hypothetical protein [Rhodoferax antarcticus]